MPATSSRTDSATTWPAAVSERSARLLAGRARGATVLAVFPLALYLRVDHCSPLGLLPVVAPQGLRLPNALVLGSDPPQLGWGVQPGDPVRVGEGEVRLPRATIRRVRLWRPPRVTAAPHVSDLRPAGVAGALASPAWVVPARHLAAAALAGRPVGDQVAATVGAGGGLTPSGDDMLCGLLLALRVAGATDAVASLWATIGPRLGQTTTVSACLLAEAAQGYAVPAVVRLTAALRGGRGAATDLSAAAHEVAAIGHSSGADLLAGLVGGLAAVRGGCERGVVLGLHTVVPQPFSTAPTGVAP